MPFGLRNAGQSFQRYISRALGDLDFVFAYLDDILIASSSPEEHEEHLRIVLQRLKEFSLSLNIDKCEFGKTELVFLSHLINRDGFKPTEKRLKAVIEFPKPKTVVELRRFLGKVNFYRRCLPHAAKVQAPLTQYLGNSVKNDKREVAWTSEAEEAFSQVKTDLANAALLTHPSADAETRVVTDASDSAMEAVVEQKQEGLWKPLAFFSQKFSSAQRNYSTYDRELTAVFEAIKYFKYFLEGCNFKVVTDHKPLIYAFQKRSDKAAPRQQRQLSFISQFTTCIEHIPGLDNVVADSLSHVDSLRLPAAFDLLELAEQQKADDQLKEISESPDFPLTMKRIEWGQNHNIVYCELTGKTLRPYIPVVLRKRVFDIFHNPAHPSAKVTDQVIRQRYA